MELFPSYEGKHLWQGILYHLHPSSDHRSYAQLQCSNDNISHSLKPDQDTKPWFLHRFYGILHMFQDFLWIPYSARLDLPIPIMLWHEFYDASLSLSGIVFSSCVPMYKGRHSKSQTSDSVVYHALPGQAKQCASGFSFSGKAKSRNEAFETAGAFS